MRIMGLLVLIFIVFSVFLAGCEESSSTGDRQARLAGEQNISLKKQLASCQAHLQEQKVLLKDCQQAKDVFEEAAAEIPDQATIEKENHLFTDLMEKLAKTDAEAESLRQQNQQLRSEIEQLKKGL